MWKRDYSVRKTLLPLQRTKIFDATVKRVVKDYFDPRFNGVEWPELAANAREDIIKIENPEEFEMAIHGLVRKLGTSHTGFFHKSVKRVPARLAIGATFTRTNSADCCFWAVQDVHSGGPADLAGLRRGDVLLSVAGRNLDLKEPPMFSMGTATGIIFSRAGTERAVSLFVPHPRSRKQPYAEPQAVTWRLLQERVGYLKVSILPGLLGLDVAREIDHAIAQFEECDGLIVDLRGHLGGGLGVLRLMSYLSPVKRPIGYTVTRRRAEKGYDKATLPVLDRLPTHLPNPLAIASMSARFLGRDPSILLVSENMGRRRWHDHIALIVNEHTASAGEMVAAFASENKLATTVGTETAGRLIPGSGFDVGHGYMLIMPKAEYLTWKGAKYEGRGIAPTICLPWSLDHDSDSDPQVEAALRQLDFARPIASQIQ